MMEIHRLLRAVGLCDHVSGCLYSPENPYNLEECVGKDIWIVDIIIEEEFPIKILPDVRPTPPPDIIPIIIENDQVYIDKPWMKANPNPRNVLDSEFFSRYQLSIEPR